MKHTHKPKSFTVRPFFEPVVTHGQNFRAHGGVTEWEECECGLVRKTNRNGKHTEVSDWHKSEPLTDIGTDGWHPCDIRAEEILAEITRLSECEDGSDQVARAFDLAEGLYWFCADNHSGQWSRLYSVLSRLTDREHGIGYRPGPFDRAIQPDSILGWDVYTELTELDRKSSRKGVSV